MLKYEYEFVIHTNKSTILMYNEMCAFVTGDYETNHDPSERYSTLYFDTVDPEHYLTITAHELKGDYLSPCFPCEDKNGDIHSLMIHLIELPTADEVARIKRRAHAFTLMNHENPVLNGFKILGFGLIVRTIREEIPYEWNSDGSRRIN